MLDFIFAMIAVGAASGTPAPQVAAATPTAPSQTGTPSVVIGSNVSMGAGVTIGGAVAAPSGGVSLLDGTSDEVAPAATAAAPEPQAEFNMAVVPAGLLAEPQDATGKFTTAIEVKPIMQATRGNWVAVREYGGQDLLYVTHIWGWRCGLHAMAISVNGEAMQNWPLPPCHLKYATPNAVLEEDGLPYLTLKQGAVQTIDIQLVYDDLSMDKARFERGNVLIP